MFQESIEAFGDFDKYVFHHPASGNNFAIVPAHGACLLDLQLNGQRVLDGCQTPEELQRNEWGKSALLFPFPNRLREGRYQFDGRTFLFPINDTPTGNALHGFGLDAPFRVKHRDYTSEKAQLHCQYVYQGERNEYPFPFIIDAIFTIARNGTFSFQLKMTNSGTTRLPAGLGWHPYFRLSDQVDDLQLQLPATELIEIDATMIPTGKRYTYDYFKELRNIGRVVLDNGFVVLPTSEPATLRLATKGFSLSYRQETGPRAGNFLQLFTPPHRQSIAIEPMTCNIDAFNNGEGLVVLEPGEEVHLHHLITSSPHLE